MLMYNSSNLCKLLDFMLKLCCSLAKSQIVLAPSNAPLSFLFSFFPLKIMKNLNDTGVLEINRY